MILETYIFTKFVTALQPRLIGNNMKTRENEKLRLVVMLEAERWKKEADWKNLEEKMKILLFKILSENPQNLSAHINLAAVYADAGDYEKALHYLEKVKKAGTDDKNFYLNLGYVMVNLKYPEDEYRKYLDLAKDKIANPLTFEAYFDPHAH